MDFKTPFRYIFDDRDWPRKLGLAVLIMVVPFLNFAWLGYQVQVIRNVRDRQLVILPTWEDLGKKLVDGLMIVLAGFIYALPAILLAFIPMVFMFIPMFAAQNQDLFSALMTGSTILYFAFTCLIFLYALVLSFFYPLVQISYAREGTFASCFNLRGIIRAFSSHASHYFLIWLVVLGVSFLPGMALAFVGILFGWFPIIGQLLVMALSVAASLYPVVVASHLYGQFAALVDAGPSPAPAPAAG